ncbi:hypothetical protein [Streptomyces sp. NPDC096033]
MEYDILPLGLAVFTGDGEGTTLSHVLEEMGRRTAERVWTGG